MSAAASQSGLRLVVLGNRPAVCTILGLQDHEQGEDGDQQCSKYRGEAAGRKVVIVSSPAWFSSSCTPEDRRKHISSLIASSSPGPHAFLLCIPLNQPADGEAKALDVLEKLFGSSAVSANTIILFTHTEELEEDEQLEQFLRTWRKDLLKLVEQCGGRYHTLETRQGDSEERKAPVEELLEKVEQVVEESGTQHVSCPLYLQAEEKLREKQVEIVRKKRREEEVGEQGSPTNSEEDVTEEEMEAVRAEAERSGADVDVSVEDIFPSTSVSSSSSSSSPAPLSFLRRLWVQLTGWIWRLPSLVRREALLGALVGLFVGGQAGGMVGATVGSVATEVGRRKTQKTK
ncbi:GTPase IMAP family member 7 isoform X2 [Parambassis ranga]|uniref:GTPase IMAP family member 7 isoform X2 n=1 Tax=Parambassis ranga TaxID=210632 RepID=A0A6P7ISD9_9TELE|nr:GTPase IMAP family member 7-like isoform X2 [Parambassis ranga]